MYRSGLALAIGSYLLWGLFPLYWPLLEPAAPVEILAHRIVWSFVLLFALLAIAGGARRLLKLDRETVRLLAAAAALMAVNWGVFIYAVNSDRVVEASLGYFINPLVSVALAVGVLRERLRSLQRLAVAVAGAGVLVLTVGYGEVPWIGLVLACSFGTYGLLKKRVEIDAIGGLAVESAFLVVPALAFLLWLGADGSGTFTSEDTGHVLLLVGSGAVTALPLILFGAAANRIGLATLGLLQYINPSMQFLIGVAVYDEAMPAERLAGFALIWVAIVILSADAVRSTREATPAASADGPQPVLSAP